MKYKIGLIARKGQKHIASCGCGTIKMLGTLGWRELETPKIECDACGNTNFVNMKGSNRVVTPYIEVIKKDRKGFKAKRTNLSVFHDEFYNVGVKPNMVQILIYDLLSSTFKMYKNGKSLSLTRRWGNHKYYYEEVMRFFSGVDHYKFKRMVSCEETEALFDFAMSKLSTDRGYDKKFYIGLSELSNYGYMQILANAGFPNVERFYETNSYYHRNNPVINKEGTSPKDILGMPKFVLKHIRENQNVGLFEMRQIKESLKKIDGNRFRELMDIVKDESTISELCRTLDNLIEIHDTYGYNNLKKLTLYLFREIRMNQGITSAESGSTLLRDYIKMSVKLGQEYEKYPKSLKKDHDVTMMNYNVQKNEIKKKEFLEAVSSEFYKSLEYKKKEYSIITPNEMQDLIKEGSELSHCVASYVDSIVSNKCRILFLRKSHELETPLATVEVRGENVRQARGYANRLLRQEERDFIAEWANKKDLELNFYY